MDIHNPVTIVPLIGDKYSNLLKKINISTVEDLLYHFPFRYDDFSKISDIASLVVNETATVYGTVAKIRNIYTKSKKRLTRATLTDKTGSIEILWFNQHFLTRNIKAETKLGISGTVELFDGKLAFIGPEYEIIKNETHQTKTLHTGCLVPIYPETRGISSKWLRSRINTAINILVKDTDLEFVPNDLLEKERLLNLNNALQKIHFPKNSNEVNTARKRFAFEEFFLLHLKSVRKRKDWKRREVARTLALTKQYKNILEAFKSNLPFTLTRAQSKCIDEIINDMLQNKPMNRLLEGDVGSGKTVVSVAGLLLNFLNKGKSLYIAPTEILANQHFNTLNNFLSKYNIKIGLLTGSKKKWGLDNDIIVATHAILYSKAELLDVSFIVIDEQHRFGVEQRAQILKKTQTGKTPHLLTMTATPIPRSLALTIYGDLDLSIIDEMPKERKKVTTWVVPNSKRQGAYTWIEDKIKKENIQAFIVCPFIEESETESLKNIKAAKVEFEKLSKIFNDVTLGLIHGKMKIKEKDGVINRFRSGEIDILVSTPVVEVGVDIPNAAIMVIEGADRFGLASLHQLRGRVGRGEQKSYCLIFSSNYSKHAYARLKYMEKLYLGIKLARVDLKLRGPGNMYGIEQHGIPNLKVGDIFDTELISNTRKYALEYIEKLNSYPKLKEKVEYITKGDIEPN